MGGAWRNLLLSKDFRITRIKICVNPGAPGPPKQEVVSKRQSVTIKVVSREGFTSLFQDVMAPHCCQSDSKVTALH